MQSLAQLTLESVIHNLDDEALRQTLEKCEIRKLMTMKKMIDRILQQTKKEIYIVTDYYHKHLHMKPIVAQLVTKYRNVSISGSGTYRDNTLSDMNHGLNRMDPILVILAAVFGYKLKWSLDKEELNITQYIRIKVSEQKDEHISVECYPPNEEEDYDYKTFRGKYNGEIPDRPAAFYQDLVELSLATGWKMEVESAERILPKEGKYRLLD